MPQKRLLPAFCTSLPVAPSASSSTCQSTPKRRLRPSSPSPLPPTPLRHPPILPPCLCATHDGRPNPNTRVDATAVPTSSPYPSSCHLPNATANDDIPPDSLNTLRHHKLALHLTDLVSRISAEFPHPLPSTLSPLLLDIKDVARQLYPDALTSQPKQVFDTFPYDGVGDDTDTDAANNRVCSDDEDAGCNGEGDAELRASARSLLWRLRKALYPLFPSPALRSAFEITRSACLHTPSVVHGNSSFSSNAFAIQLSTDIVLLQELHALRHSERIISHCVVQHHGRHWPGLSATCAAAIQLGLENYRVVGISRLVQAVGELVSHIETLYPVHPEVESAVDDLHSILRNASSLQKRRRAVGRAMLLRPRISDIPNFDRVTDSLLRGGQPSQAGIQWLYDYGVTVVIDLRGSDRRNQWHSATSCRYVNVADGVNAPIDEITLDQEPEQPLLEHLALDNNNNNNNNNNNTDLSNANGHLPIATNNSKAVDFTASKVGQLSICNIPVEDFGTPSLEQIDQFISLVNSVHDKDGVVFVHCKAGIGRTGTLIACWRIFHGMSADQALAKERLYSDFGGGLRQETFVRQYAASRNGVPNEN